MEPKPSISFEDTAVAFDYKSDAELRKANFIFSLVNHPWISFLATGMVKVPEIRGILRLPGFRIEKLIYQSLPEVYVTANLYVPDGIGSQARA